MYSPNGLHSLIAQKKRNIFVYLVVTLHKDVSMIFEIIARNCLETILESL